MPRIQLIFILLLLYVETACAQGFSTNSLKGEYRSTDTIRFMVLYPTTDTSYLSIGLEEKVNGNWLEITDDISKESLSSVRIEVRKLCCNVRDTVEWIPGHLPQFGEKTLLKGSFRFVFYSAISIDALNINPFKQVSEEFILK